MIKRVRKGSVKVTRYKLNLSMNQYERHGMKTIVITHYKDGHYHMSIDGKKGARVNALLAAALISNNENLEELSIKI